MILFLDEDCAFLDDVEGVSIISLIEDDLPLLVCLSEAGGCKSILLFFSEFLKER